MEVHNIVGTVLVQQGRVEEGVEEWKKVLLVEPNNGNAISNLAWVFATSPDESIRNGAKALQLAEQAVRISEGRIAVLFRTLAAAYAENGRFSDAIQTAQRGIELANSQGNSGLATELQASIALYQERQPLRHARGLVVDDVVRAARRVRERRDGREGGVADVDQRPDARAGARVLCHDVTFERFPVCHGPVVSYPVGRITAEVNRRC